MLSLTEISDIFGILKVTDDSFPCQVMFKSFVAILKVKLYEILPSENYSIRFAQPCFMKIKRTLPSMVGHHSNSVNLLVFSIKIASKLTNIVHSTLVHFFIRIFLKWNL